MYLSKQRVVTLALVAVLSVMALAGIFGLGAALHSIDRRNADSECVRRVTAMSVERFELNIGDLIDASFARDIPRARAAAERLKNASHLVDLLAKECPSAIRPTTTKEP